MASEIILNKLEDLYDLLESNRCDDLNSFEQDFVTNMHDGVYNHSNWTEKQLTKIEEIWDKYIREE